MMIEILITVILALIFALYRVCTIHPPVTYECVSSFELPPLDGEGEKLAIPAGMRFKQVDADDSPAVVLEREDGFFIRIHPDTLAQNFEVVDDEQP